MKVSLNWLREYINIEQNTTEIEALLTDLGLEVEGIEELGGIEGNLEGIVVGEVVECDRHPDADRLSLTKINIGKIDLLQIVCGASNISKGQKVVVATTGATLYPIEGESFKIKKGKIRGQESEGMICAEDEIGVGKSHAGIIVLPAETVVGTPAIEVFDIEKDTVFEIGLTPNRSDATCHVGVARDLGARLRVNGAASRIKLPDVSAFSVKNKDLKIQVSVENEAACPRYAGLCIENIKVGDSPEWLKKRLESIGVRSINNVVDVTNFVLHESGQPLHAFDLDQISGQKIIVKTLPEGTKFKSLDEVERALFAEDLMICDGDSKGMCIGGVFGGFQSGVTESTTRIFLEAAHFSPKSIRRSSMRHNLRTDAAKVFEKGSDPNLCVFALKRAALLLEMVAGGRVASELIDIYPNPIPNVEVTVRYTKLRSLIGKNIETHILKTIFEALDMKILEENADGVRISIPSNKADVLREVDVVEEILRVYGFNNVEMPTQIRSAITKSEYPDPVRVRNLTADLLAANGFNEMMAMSLTRSKYFLEILPMEKENLVFVNNTSTIELDVMRPTMLTSALECVLHNQNRQNSDLKLFEFGKTYKKRSDTGGGAFLEENRLALTLTGAREKENWHVSPQATSFYTLKSYVNLVMQRLGLSGYQETVLEDAAAREKGFSIAIRYHRGQSVLVEFGGVSKSVSKTFDIKKDVYFADFQWDNVLKAAKNTKIQFEELSRFPTVRRDLALVIPSSVRFSEVQQIANKVGKKMLKSVNLFSVFEDTEKLGADKKSYAISFLFENKERTLQEKEIESVMSDLISQYETKLSALIRR